MTAVSHPADCGCPWSRYTGHLCYWGCACMSMLPTSPLTLNEYQRHVLRTSKWDDSDRNRSAALTNWALGAAGEAGELADLVKKHVFHEHDLDEAKAVKELGDILWYVARMAKTLGVTLEEVAQLNVEKLQKRYPNGWSREDSINRVDTKEG